MAARKFGWRRDLPDHRDRAFALKLAPAQLPRRVNLRERFPVPCPDQGVIGSCTGNAIAAAVQYDRMQDGKETFAPSRLFIYFNERVIEDTVFEDAGATIRNGIKSIARWGTCPEDRPGDPSNWAYDEERFTDRPPPEAYAFGADHQAVQYARLPQTLVAMKSCLAGGHPFVFGFAVCERLMSEDVKKTGLGQLPLRDERVLGGHAVLTMGYDDGEQRFSIRNSWGPEWGDSGYFSLPYSYLTSRRLAADFWVVTKLEA